MVKIEKRKVKKNTEWREKSSRYLRGQNKKSNGPTLIHPAQTERPTWRPNIIMLPKLMSMLFNYFMQFSSLAFLTLGKIL
jgi:hypothetical protein